MRRAQTLLLILATTLTLAIAACGEDSSDPGPQAVDAAPAQTASQPANAPAPPKRALEHVHGLGVNDRDGALYVATHNGLFRAAANSRRAEPVGESQKDVMGFSVAAPGRFLGSGHPGPGEDLPANLGLIESRDGGRSWQPVSLLGEVDFHVLRAAGRRVYGYDGAQGLKVSRDGGRTWTDRAVPAPVFDLALDPQDSERLVAATEAGLFTSPDGGGTWRPVNQQIGGLLAWPERGALHLVGPVGEVLRSADQGRSFRQVGSIGGEAVAFMAHRGDLYAALGDGTVMRSGDGGASWVVRAAP